MQVSVAGDVRTQEECLKPAWFIHDEEGPADSIVMKVS